MVTNAPVLEELKQDQAVEPGAEEVKEKEAGTEKTVDTAATEKKTSTTDETVKPVEEPVVDEFSIDVIGSEGEVKKADDALKLEGLSDESQERVNRKIIGANNDKKTAQEETKKSNARVKELEAELAQKTAPTQRPKMPLERNFDNDEVYQKAVDEYQDDTIAYNAAVNDVKTQETVQVERVKTNDSRLLVQMDELQKKFPDVDITATISEIANAKGYGNAAAFIADSEHSGRIALFLAKNEGERLRIGSLTDVGAINREIGKLEQEFTRSRKKQTTAPAALSTIDNKSNTVIKNIMDIKDDTEYFKARQAEKVAAFKAKEKAQ
ncbi:MAG: hypothetical protein ACUZ8I_14425 [Candidatus Scalindua sp.]